YMGTGTWFWFQASGDFSHEDTEEICQETFLSVVRNLPSFQGRSSFQTWLLRIAANKAMDYREKTRAAKRGGNAVHISIDAGRADNEPPIDPPSGNPGPDALLQIAETSRLVRESLDRLGEPCREIIELRYYGELSYDEIAAELRLNPKTVSSRLSKCLDPLLFIVKEIFPTNNRLQYNLKKQGTENKKPHRTNARGAGKSASRKFGCRPQNAKSDATPPARGDHANGSDE